MRGFLDLEFAKVNYNAVRPLETRVLSFLGVVLFSILHIIKYLSAVKASSLFVQLLLLRYEKPLETIVGSFL